MLITATNWTWEYIDDYMTFPRLDAMLEYWEEVPAQAFSVNEVRTILRSYFKIKDNTKKKRRQAKQSEEEFAQAFNELARLMS